MPKRSTTRITQSVASKLEVNPDKEYTVFDNEVKGFGLRIQPAGSKTFILMYRNEYGKQRKLTLGPYGSLTVVAARQLAQAKFAEIASGNDPVRNAQEKRNVLTVGELADQYFEDCKAGRVLYRGKAKSQTTINIDRGRIDRHIKPLLGNIHINELTMQQVQKFLSDVTEGATATKEKTKTRGVARVTGGKGTAVKAVNLLSAMFNYAIRNGMLENNPCRLVEKPADGKRTRFLRKEEYKSLGEALISDHGISPICIAAIEILALTGCRRNEILNLKPENIDIEGRCLRLAETKTGPQIRPCGQVALQRLNILMQAYKSTWVFPSIKGNGPLVNIRKPMLKICELAEFEEVTPHVLRHSYATVASELGYSELIISGLLGHAAGTVTSRYAHHVDYVLADAADMVSKTIVERME